MPRNLKSLSEPWRSVVLGAQTSSIKRVYFWTSTPMHIAGLSYFVLAALKVFNVGTKVMYVPMKLSHVYSLAI